MAAPAPFSRPSVPSAIRTSSDCSSIREPETPSSTASTLVTESNYFPTMAGRSQPGSPMSSTSPMSPTERSFFSAITHKVRERSRSRTRVARSRSKSPMPPTTTQRYSTISQSSAEPHPRPNRSSTSGSTTSEDFYYGRHANQWLFNGFSVRAHVRDLVSKSDKKE